MGRIFQFFSLTITLVCCQVAFAESSLDSALIKARKALAQNHPQQAYKTLAPLVNDFSGQPKFDQLYGQAALASQHQTQAVMAFERCLAVMPQNGNCHLGLAQAYIQLKETQHAKSQLKSIQQSQPPEAVKRIVENYLGLLEDGLNHDRQNLQAWLALGLGFDDNPNTAPTSNHIALPLFPGVNLTYSSEADKTSYGKLSAGLSYRHPLTQSIDLVTGGLFNTTRNFSIHRDESYFDHIDQLTGHLGFLVHKQQHSYGLSALAENYRLGGATYRNAIGLRGRYSYLINPRTQLATYLQYRRTGYKFAPNELQDTHNYVAGLTLAQSLVNDQLILTGGLYLGRDIKIKHLANSNIESHYQGLHTNATWRWNSQQETGLTLLAEHRKYNGRAELLGIPLKQRRDYYISGKLNHRYFFTSALSGNLFYQHIRDYSNIDFRKFNRNIIGAEVRYDFF